jgi:hypothetical protein
MKRNSLFCIISIAALIFTASALTLAAADSPAPISATYEYVTIRWAGRDNTHVIRPNGEVEFVGSQLKNFKKPDRADERSFCMNIVMNGLAREGWELAGMTPDDYVMKRQIKR